MDVSTEELQHVLAECPRGLLYVRDELAGWLGGFDRYGGKGDDRAFYLECWNGGSYVCDRVRYHGTPLRIEHASLAIIVGMVPDRLREVLADTDDGLVERMLFIWPEPVPIGALRERGATDAAEHRIALYEAARKLHALELGADDVGRPAPRALRLDGAALACYEQRLAVRRPEPGRASRRAGRAKTRGERCGWHWTLNCSVGRRATIARLSRPAFRWTRLSAWTCRSCDGKAVA